jgi:Lon protease-like protein
MQLPLFPLHAVLFPRLPLPLQIFEERYRTMIRDVLADGSPYAGRFLVSMITHGSEVGADPARQPLSARVGTVVEVRHAERFADGRWALLAVGLARATVESVERSGPYPVAEVDQLSEEQGDPTTTTALLRRVQGALDAYLESVKRYAAAASVGRESHEIGKVTGSLDEVLKPIRLPDDPLAASYAVGGMLQIELTRKQQLLEMPDAGARLTAELQLLRREARLLADGAISPMSSADLHYNPN